MESQLRMQHEQLKKQREEQMKAMQRQLEVCCHSDILFFTQLIYDTLISGVHFCVVSTSPTSTWPRLNSDVGLEEGEY